MFIKIGEDRINVEQINTYLFNNKTKVLTICFLNDAVRIYHDATQLVQELDRVCNPKELRGLEEVIPKATYIRELDEGIDICCPTCKFEGLELNSLACMECNAAYSNWKAKDE